MLINLIIFFITEIGRVRGNLFQINGKKSEPLVLPDASGAPINLSEKVYVPIKEYPDVSIEQCICQLSYHISQFRPVSSGKSVMPQLVLLAYRFRLKSATLEPTCKDCVYFIFFLSDTPTEENHYELRFGRSH